MDPREDSDTRTSMIEYQCAGEQDWVENPHCPSEEEYLIRVVCLLALRTLVYCG